MQTCDYTLTFIKAALALNFVSFFVSSPKLMYMRNKQYKHVFRSLFLLERDKYRIRKNFSGSKIKRFTPKIDHHRFLIVIVYYKVHHVQSECIVSDAQSYNAKIRSSLKFLLNIPILILHSFTQWNIYLLASKYDLIPCFSCIPKEIFKKN